MSYISDNFCVANIITFVLYESSFVTKYFYNSCNNRLERWLNRLLILGIISVCFINVTLTSFFTLYSLNQIN